MKLGPRSLSPGQSRGILGKGSKMVLLKICGRGCLKTFGSENPTQLDLDLLLLGFGTSLGQKQLGCPEACPPDDKPMKVDPLQQQQLRSMGILVRCSSLSAPKCAAVHILTSRNLLPFHKFQRIPHFQTASAS